MLKLLRCFLTSKILLRTIGNRTGNSNYCSLIDSKLINKLEYLLVLDFEATCCDVKKNFIQEIIEFPCVKINLASLKEEGRFHHYVRPVINPQLTKFCVNLTGILQEMIDDEKTFPEVLALFEKWRLNEGLTKENSLYVTSGDWDLGHMMPVQCQQCQIQLPDHMYEWIDIKKVFALANNLYFDTFIQILGFYKLKFQGRPHSGIDDCLNICNALRKIAMSGVDFKPTSKLLLCNSKRKVVNVLYQNRVLKYNSEENLGNIDRGRRS